MWWGGGSTEGCVRGEERGREWSGWRLRDEIRPGDRKTESR